MPPNRLYKYRGLDKNRGGAVPYEWDRSIILDCKLWAGSPLGFNDRFDCYPDINFEFTKEEFKAWTEHYASKHGVSISDMGEKVRSAFNDLAARERILDWGQNVQAFGVVSLTERADDMVMWAHYADSNKGYCLELDATIQPFRLARRVSYTKERPVFRYFDPNRADIIERTFLQKADCWKYEREWRIIRPAEQGPVEFFPHVLKSIIFGADIEDKDEKALRAIATEREITVAYKRVKLHKSNYQFEIIDA